MLDKEGALVEARRILEEVPNRLYGRVFEDGVMRPVKYAEGGDASVNACHNGFTVLSQNVGALAVYTRSGGIGYGIPFDDCEATRAYVAYLIGPTSPWRSVTKEFNTDVDWVIENGYVVGDLDTTPANHVYNFMIATRFGSEYAAACKRIWYPLVLAGVHPALALVASTQPQDGRYWDYHHGPLPMGCDPVRLAKGKMIAPTGAFATGSPVTPTNVSWGQSGVFKFPERPRVSNTDSLGRTINRIDYSPEALSAVLLEEQKRLGLESL